MQGYINWNNKQDVDITYIMCVWCRCVGDGCCWFWLLFDCVHNVAFSACLCWINLIQMYIICWSKLRSWCSQYMGRCLWCCLRHFSLSVSQRFSSCRESIGAWFENQNTALMLCRQSHNQKEIVNLMWKTNKVGQS